MAVEARSVSPRTVLATENAMADSAAVSHSTASKAPPRRLRGLAFWLSRTPLRRLVVRAANKKLGRGQARFYPAPRIALQCCKNAFCMTAERALSEAQAADTLIRAGRQLGTLHGIPYAVKDIIDVAGLPTTAGSRLLEGNVATEDS